MSDEKQECLFLLDGMAMVYRSHFAMIRTPVMTSGGINTSAVFGYLNTLHDIMKKWQPSHIAVAFDTSEPTFRHEDFPEYKANRDKMPEDLSLALPYVFKVTEALNIPVLRYPGHEADDVIGTLAKMGDEQGMPVYMVTPDKDFAQLVTENVRMLRTGQKGIRDMGVAEVLEEWGIERVDQIIDYLGMAGDASDNIPGIPGVGAKTAQKLIAEYGNIEGVIENSDKLKGKLKERVQENVDQVRLCRKLVTINTDVPVTHTIDDLKRQEFNKEALSDLFTELEFSSLAKRYLGDDYAGAAPEKLKTLDDVKHDYQIVTSDADIDMLINRLNTAESFCFDLETTSKEASEAEVVGIGFCFEPGKAFYLPYPDEGLLGIMLLDRLKEVFENPASMKIGHNLKYDISVLRNYNIRVNGPLWDTMLAHYILAPEAGHGMDELATHYLKYKPISFTEVTDGDLFAGAVDVKTMGEYCCEDTDVTLQLKKMFEPMLKENNAEAIFKIECDLVSVLVDMQGRGIRFDVGSLKDFSIRLGDELKTLQADIWEHAGEQFNINSGKQLGIILFEKLKLDEKPAKTKTGQYKTDEQVLTKLAHKHEIVAQVSRFKGLEKLKNTYVEKLPGFVSRKTGRIHTHFNQAVTSTGRIASDRPNLQNIPIRTADGQELRKAFVPSGSDFLLLSADYSQIELRIIAEFSDSTHLINAFKSGEDVHTTTAALVYGINPSEVTREMRSKSKMVNYGIAYGISAFGLSQRLNIPRKEAADIIAQYFNAFPEIKEYIETTLEFAREHEYVETPLGRRRYLPDINSRNGTVKKSAERNAINMPVQGTSADMIKVAMVRINKAMADANMKSQMLLQIHDELLFDAHRDEVDALRELVVQHMINAIDMKVPVEVDAGVGETWLEAH